MRDPCGIDVAMQTRGSTNRAGTDPRGTDVATQTRGSTNGVGTDPRERLHGAMAKWAEWIGPTGIVDPVGEAKR